MPNQRARVLADNTSIGIKNGQIVEASDKVIKSLAEAGTVDPHEDAVAYAESVNAEVVDLTSPAAASDKKSSPT